MRPTISEQQDFERRKSTVDNLERLYTVLAGLALTTAIGKLLQESTTVNLNEPVVRIANIDVYYATLPMFSTLIVTLIPFYHGANRYLYENYVFLAHDAGEANATPGNSVALIDFLFFFSQAILFYAMSLILRQPIWFYWCYVAVLALDCAWLALVRLESRNQWDDVQAWFWINAVTVMATFVVLSTPLLPDDLRKWIFLSVISVVRTTADYGLGWSFYWPRSTRKASRSRAPRRE